MVEMDVLEIPPEKREEIAKAMRALHYERAHGDKLRIALAEAALNDLLDRLKPDH